MIALLLLAQAIPAEELLLTCDGATIAQMNSSSTDISIDDNRGYSVDGSVNTRKPSVARYTIQLRISGTDAEMTMPALVVPQINSNRGGWFKVKKLVVSENEISGRVRFNFLSSSTFRIDRRTGEITSSGGFHGTCQKQDLSQRAF